MSTSRWSRNTVGIRKRFNGPDDLFEVGGSVLLVASHRGRGRSSGAEVHGRTAYVYTLRDGMIARVELYADVRAIEWTRDRAAGDALNLVGRRGALHGARFNKERLSMPRSVPARRLCLYSALALSLAACGAPSQLPPAAPNI